MSRRGGGGGGGGNGAKIPSGATGGGPAVPVPPYNPLLDRNLAGYFSSARVQRQLHLPPHLAALVAWAACSVVWLQVLVWLGWLTPWALALSLVSS